MEAIAFRTDLETIVIERLGSNEVDYDEVESDARILRLSTIQTMPIVWSQEQGSIISGVRCARDAMHTDADKSKITDSMKMFNLGLQGGKPEKGKVGAQPEWFYKGDGGCIVPPGHPLNLPSFALGGGERPRS